MLFSTLEGIGLLALMLALFRFKITQFIWPALFTILIMNLQSYIMRNELSLAYLAPVVNIVIFIFFIATVVKEPLVGSALITITGYLAYALLQTALVPILIGSIRQVQDSLTNGYILQSGSFLLDVLLAWILYRYGKGFSFDFEKFRLKKENVIVVFLIVGTLIAFGIILFKNDILINGLFFTVALLLFLYYAVIKERSEE
jgi:hypothetical protein